MSSIDVEVVDATKVEFSSVDSIKTMINTLNEQISVNKLLMTTLRALLKDTEKTTKELDKLPLGRNRSRPHHLLTVTLGLSRALKRRVARLIQRPRHIWRIHEFRQKLRNWIAAFVGNLLLLRFGQTKHFDDLALGGNGRVQITVLFRFAHDTLQS